MQDQFSEVGCMDYRDKHITFIYEYMFRRDHTLKMNSSRLRKSLSMSYYLTHIEMHLAAVAGHQVGTQQQSLGLQRARDRRFYLI